MRTALFALGFRPFYLLAALFAAAAVPAWVADLAGYGWPAGYLDGLAWHQHEMVFGFALAVIAGFLLTAARVWTGRPTLSGLPLALLAAHWLVARVLMLT
ncbi:MAG: NnrS family protein, partial [Burkholderiales bacterium]